MKGGIELKLRRSRENAVVSGVLGGLGEYYKIDPTVIRIGFVVLLFLDIFPLIPLYIIGAILIPKAERKDRNIDKSSIDNHNMEELSEINEDDWSDF